MKEENTKLQDFGTGEKNDQEESEEFHSSAKLSSFDPDDNSTSVETTQSGCSDEDQICPHHKNGIQYCENNVKDDMIDELRLNKIGCGLAIEYLSKDLGVYLSENTVDGYSSYLRRYVEFLHKKGLTVCEAEIQDVEEYINKLVTLNRAQATIASYRTAITNLYTYILSYHDIDINIRPSTIRERIKLSRLNTPEPRERVPLTKKEVRKLYAEMDGFRDRLLVQVGVELGPRSQDARSIVIEDIDFESGNIELSNTKSGGSYTLPITSQLLLLLRRWVDQERAAHPGSEGTEYLFPSRLGGNLGKSGFERIVKEAAKRAGIQEKEESETPLTEREKEVLGTDKDYVTYHKVTPHTLRHTFNHLLQKEGIPREARSLALDHQSEEVTKEHYDHEESNYQELIRELFNKKSSFID